MVLGMGRLPKELIFAFLFAFIFSVALFYVSLEIPHILDVVLRKYFPDIFYDIEEIEVFLDYVRPIGYLAFLIVILLIILGFVTRYKEFSFLGSLAMYLPVFGYFASAMFFLAGIGVLRVLWLPFFDTSSEIFMLGHIVLIPLYIEESIISYHLGWRSPIHALFRFFTITIIFAGILIFFLGSSTWLYGTFKKVDITDFWIYRYSRHPQYLGYIVWSYGYLLLVPQLSYIRGAFAIPPSLIWVISTMIIIGVALHEEIILMELYGERYADYRRRTPFMISLPKPLTSIILLPARIITRDIPKNRKEIFGILVIYTVIIFIVSYGFVKLTGFIGFIQ